MSSNDFAFAVSLPLSEGVLNDSVFERVVVDEDDERVLREVREDVEEALELSSFVIDVDSECLKDSASRVSAHFALDRLGQGGADEFDELSGSVDGGRREFDGFGDLVGETFFAVIPEDFGDSVDV